ncbi:unnamed protein product [Knipowitschia caucasica]|uniref:MICOS complex subunit n=1 Tax=Knipowitschia caucasica TaxID=637954 RepID=A0AAV2LBF3_KNICA
MSYTKLVSLCSLAPGLVGAMGMIGGPVHAASPGPKKSSAPGMSLEELPSLYTRPDPLQSPEPQSNALEEQVSVVRLWLQPHTDQYQESSRAAKEQVERAYRRVEPTLTSCTSAAAELYQFLKDPPPQLLPSAAAIGFSGVLGVYLSNGSRLKRALFPLGLVALSSSLFYPQQAAALLQWSREQAMTCYGKISRLPKKKSGDKESKGES